ncbi:MAG: AAA family ATPase, partial [Ktedonobacteraceae bacterium]|nr:AAA family ATPase [Ktedonobacteraceae bacterium]
MQGKITYHQQVSYCGKPRCRKCREGVGHGPYWYSYQTVGGRTTRTYIGKQLPPEVQAEMEGQRDTTSPQARERDAAAIKIYSLGQFRLERRNSRDNSWETVTDSAWQHQRVRSLLTSLVSSTGRKLGREQIMDALWPDLDVEAASGRLDRAVYSLRQLFEPSRGRLATSPLVLTEREMLVLGEYPLIWVDADAFEKLLMRAHESDDPGEKENLLEEAMLLYGGDFLPEERKFELTLARRESLRRSWIGMLLELSDLRSKRDALSSAIEPLDRLLSIDPANEAAVQRLISLLAQQGRRAEAIRTYRNLAKVLQQEYRIAPLPETRALYEAVSKGTQPVRPRTSPTLPEGVGERVASGTSQAPIVQIGRAHQSPLVGRQQEIAVLQELLSSTEQAARFKLPVQKRSFAASLDPQRRPQCVLLLGDVGIGKTRLAEEASRDAQRRKWTVAWSRVYAQEATIPYRLWTEVLRKAMDQGPWQRQKMSERPTIFQPLCALLPDLQLPPSTMPVSLSPEQEQLRLWEAARELLTIISENSPLLIALDDLQWADGSSCELLAYLARHLRGYPVVIVATCRDNELPASHPLRSLMTDLQRENAIESVSLPPLSDEQIDAIVANVP